METVGRLRVGRLSIAILLLVSVGLLDPSLSRAQITLDGSLRSGATSGPVNAVGSTFTIPAAVGETRGNNLFHSFGQFNVPPNFSAQFTGPPSVRNILSRVTGGVPSSIYGTIDSSSMSSANFYLLNPAGVIFGPGASLLVGGSFHVSTANYLQFADSPGEPGSRFSSSATPLPVSGLSVNPVAFGFLGPAPVRISIRPGTSLSVGSEKTFSVVGGDAPFPSPPDPLFSLPDPDDSAAGLTIAGATLRAPNGRLNVVSVGPPSPGPDGGQVVVSPTLSVNSFSRLGDMNISGSLLAASTLDPSTSLFRASGRGGTVALRGGAININASSIVDASGDPSGTVEVRAGRLVIAEGSQIQANTGEAKSAPVALDLAATEEIHLTSSSLLALSVVVDEFGQDSFGAGTTGNIKIETNGLQMQGSGFLGPLILTQSLGQTGRIDIGVGSLRLTDGGQIFSGTGLAAGDVSIVASDSILISAAGSVVSQISAPQGTGANVSVAGRSLTVDGGTVLTLTDSGAAGGSIVVNVDTLSVIGGGAISTDASGGVGGRLSIAATKAAVVSGENSRISSIGTSGSQAGNIELTVGQLTVSQNAGIQTGNAVTASVGGTINVSATGPITLSERGRITSEAFSQDVGNVTISAAALIIDNGLLQSSTSEFGRAGDISVTVGNLQLLNGGQIVTSSQGSATGQGGNLTITATGGIVISGQSPLVDGVRIPVSPFSTDPHSGLFSTASENTTPPPQHPEDPPAPLGGGTITVSAPTLSLSDGGRLSVSTPGAGPAGKIALNISGSLTMSDSGTGLFSDTGPVRVGQEPGSGHGGDINLKAGQINLLDGATISAKSTGTAEALAGNINITFGESFRLQNSSITTSSNRADGGSIAITSTSSLLYLLDSQITTSVRSDVGSGGNITIGSQAHPLDRMVLNGSQIRADAFEGPGGNIRIFADTFLTSESVLSASSALSAPGTINVQARFTNLSGNIAQLPETVVQAAALLRAACAARLSAGKTSSLVVSGREGVPLEPGGVMPSPLIAESLTDLGPSRSDGHEWEPLPGAWRVSLQSKCSM